MMIELFNPDFTLNKEGVFFFMFPFFAGGNNLDDCSKLCMMMKITKHMLPLKLSVPLLLLFTKKVHRLNDQNFISQFITTVMMFVFFLPFSMSFHEIIIIYRKIFNFHFLFILHMVRRDKMLSSHSVNMHNVKGCVCVWWFNVYTLNIIRGTFPFQYFTWLYLR